MLKIYLIIIISITSLFARLPYDKKCYEKTMKVRPNNKAIKHILIDLERIGYDKKDIMEEAYSAGKSCDLSNTLLAIVYKESHLGDYMFNTVTGDYGLAGINLKTFKRLHKLNNTYWGDKKLASELIRDDSFNLAVAINNLKGWRLYYKNNYRAIWGSYNGGWRTNSKYTNSILNIIIAFKIYFKKHPEMGIYVKGE